MTILSRGRTLFYAGIQWSRGFYTLHDHRTANLLIKIRIPWIKYSPFLPRFIKYYLSSKDLVLKQVIYSGSYWWHLYKHRVFFGHNNNSYVFFHAYRFHIGFSYVKDNRYVQLSFYPYTKVIKSDTNYKCNKK